MLRSLKKAEEVARVLKQQLEFRISKMANYNLVSEKRDANGWPILTVTTDGNEATGQPALKIRTEAFDGASDDVFNNPRKAYTPHKTTFLYEDGSNLAGDLLILFKEVADQETAVEIRETASGTAIADARLEDAPIVGEYDSIEWPTKVS